MSAKVDMKNYAPDAGMRTLRNRALVQRYNLSQLERTRIDAGLCRTGSFLQSSSFCFRRHRYYSKCNPVRNKRSNIRNSSDCMALSDEPLLARSLARSDAERDNFSSTGNNLCSAQGLGC